MGEGHIFPGTADDSKGGYGMKTDCRVIEDLIPLYLDGVCSVQTKELVEEHLGGCENCRKLIEQVHPVNMIAPAGEDAVPGNM